MELETIGAVVMGSVIKCCRKCKDRTIEPNCHMVCEKYIAQRQLQKEVNRKLYNDGWRDFWDTINANQGPRG